MFRVIDNKRIDLTDSEFEMYNKICRSYDRPNFKGEDLFRGLFETNDDGIITFVIPPEKQFSSYEVFLFLLSISQNQHLRVMHAEVASFIKEGKENMARIFEEMKVFVNEMKIVEKPVQQLHSDVGETK